MKSAARTTTKEVMGTIDHISAEMTGDQHREHHEGKHKEDLLTKKGAIEAVYQEMKHATVHGAMAVAPAAAGVTLVGILELVAHCIEIPGLSEMIGFCSSITSELPHDAHVISGTNFNDAILGMFGTVNDPSFDELDIGEPTALHGDHGLGEEVENGGHGEMVEHEEHGGHGGHGGHDDAHHEFSIKGTIDHEIDHAVDTASSSAVANSFLGKVLKMLDYLARHPFTFMATLGYSVMEMVVLKTAILLVLGMVGVSVVYWFLMPIIVGFVKLCMKFSSEAACKMGKYGAKACDTLKRWIDTILKAARPVFDAMISWLDHLSSMVIDTVQSIVKAGKEYTMNIASETLLQSVNAYKDIRQGS